MNFTHRDQDLSHQNLASNFCMTHLDFTGPSKSFTYLLIMQCFANFYYGSHFLNVIKGYYATYLKHYNYHPLGVRYSFTGNQKNLLKYQTGSLIFVNVFTN